MTFYNKLFAQLYYPFSLLMFFFEYTLYWCLSKMFKDNAQINYIKKGGYIKTVKGSLLYACIGNPYVIFTNLIAYNIICRLLKLSNGIFYFISAAVISLLSCFYKKERDSIKTYCKAFHLKPKIHKLVSCAMAYIIIILEIYLAFITNPLIK